MHNFPTLCGSTLFAALNVRSTILHPSLLLSVLFFFLFFFFHFGLTIRVTSGDNRDATAQRTIVLADRSNCFATKGLQAIAQVNGGNGLDLATALGSLSQEKCLWQHMSDVLVGSASIKNVTYYATIYLDGLLDANKYMGMYARISNGTNLLCTMQARAILVTGGPAIFSSPAYGKCDGTTLGSTAVPFNITTSSDTTYAKTNLSILYVPPGGASSSSPPSIKIDTKSTGAVPPESNGVSRPTWCANLGDGDFVVVQLNGNGTTTLYSSVDKGQTLAMMTLFTDNIPTGPPGSARTGPVVNRTVTPTAA